MMENPYDTTRWHHEGSEHADEDPLHGPEARLRLLSIPPRRREDGTYRVFGSLYGPCNTTDFDAKGRPFVRIRLGRASTMSTIRETNEDMVWVEKYWAGELPPFAEMAYPKFQLDAQPYIVFDSDMKP